jgi:hypothetical protein
VTKKAETHSAEVQNNFFTYDHVVTVFLNLYSFIRYMVEDCLGAEFFISFYSGLKCRPHLWLLPVFKLFLVISETPAFIKTFCANLWLFISAYLCSSGFRDLSQYFVYIDFFPYLCRIVFVVSA